MTYTLNIAQSTDQNAYRFSDWLMQIISNVYSSDTEVASNSFQTLIDYFTAGSATAEEREFLVMTNDNPLIYLLNALQNSNPELYELLRQTVGEVVRATAEENLNNYDLGYSDDSGSESDNDDGEVEFMGNGAAPAA